MIKNQNKNKNKKEYTQALKNKCILISFATFLSCSIWAFFSAPLPIAILGGLSFLLCILSFKKKSKEEKEALKQFKALQEALKYEESKNS